MAAEGTRRGEGPVWWKGLVRGVMLEGGVGGHGVVVVGRGGVVVLVVVGGLMVVVVVVVVRVVIGVVVVLAGLEVVEVVPGRTVVVDEGLQASQVGERGGGDRRRRSGRRHARRHPDAEPGVHQTAGASNSQHIHLDGFLFLFCPSFLPPSFPHFRM